MVINTATTLISTRLTSKQSPFSGNQNTSVRLLTRQSSRDRNLKRPPCIIPAQCRTRHYTRTLTVSGAVKAYFRRNPGVVTIISGPGSCGESKELQRYYSITHGPVLVTSFDDDCVPASILNSLVVPRGPGSKQHITAVLNNDTTVFTNSNPIGPLVYGKKLGVRVLRLTAAENKSIYSRKRNDAFERMCTRGIGVWITRLEQSGIADHCVGIDGFRSVIYYSEEQYPLHLSAKTLRMCDGDRATKLRIAEARKVVIPNNLS